MTRHRHGGERLASYGDTGIGGVRIARFRHRPSGTEYAVFTLGQGTYAVHGSRSGTFGDATEIARANVAADGAGDYLTSVYVEHGHRRRGVASALYRVIERDLKRALRPSPTHVSPDAEAFWTARKSRRRP